MTVPLTFRKSERLTLRSQIDALFKTGVSFHFSPFKVVYRFGDTNSSPGIKILVTVPKKRFKSAVARNHIKRLIREAYRLNKERTKELVLASTTELHIGFIYTGHKDDITYREIADSMVHCLEKLKHLLGNNLLPANG